LPSKLSIKNLTLSDIVIDDLKLHGLDNLEKVSIMRKVKTLPAGAFHNKKKLRKVFVDPNIQLSIIPEYCFSNCESLEKFIIPKSIVTIGEKAFRGCKNIARIEIPKTVLYVDPSSFDGWTSNQSIYHHHPFVLSDKCKAKIIELSVVQSIKERVITHESDLSIKKYIVTVKGGHVGKDYYIPLKFPIEATSKKEAAAIARQIPRVKHHHKDTILEVVPVSNETYSAQIEENVKDPYFRVHSKQEQREIDQIINDKKIKETDKNRKRQ